MIPFTVIGGFLGAGKTTLLNRVLTETHGRKYLVLVNDFGELAVDDRLIREHGGDTMTFANGCVCCTMGDNFLATLMDILKGPAAFDHIVVETSGVADPQSVAEIAVLHPKLRRDLIVVLVDAQSVRQRAEDERLSDTLARQINAADLLIVNRCDLPSSDDLAGLRAWFDDRHPDLPRLESVRADIPLDLLAEIKPRDHMLDHHRHDHGTEFRALTIEFDGPVEIDRLQTALAALPASILRVKGFVATENGAAAVQRSGRIVEIENAPEADNRLVLIGLADKLDDSYLKEQLRRTEISAVQSDSVVAAVQSV